MNGGFNSTEWKLQNFSVTPILREIKISESRVSKSAILTYLESLESQDLPIGQNSEPLNLKKLNNLTFANSKIDLT